MRLVTRMQGLHGPLCREGLEEPSWCAPQQTRASAHRTSAGCTNAILLPQIDLSECRPPRQPRDSILTGGAAEAAPNGPLRALTPLGGQVTAFSRWERELPKLVGEPRFQGVPTMKERRALFDGYCKAAPDISKRRAESKRAALEAFQALLAEATSLPGLSRPRSRAGSTSFTPAHACRSSALRTSHQLPHHGPAAASLEHKQSGVNSTIVGPAGRVVLSAWLCARDAALGCEVASSGVGAADLHPWPPRWRLQLLCIQRESGGVSLSVNRSAKYCFTAACL